jgi:biopolymer transport protein ExbD
MRTHHSTHHSVDAHQPSIALNMTPLIDVLLVLLVLMIMTVPVLTHRTALDLPGRSTMPKPPPLVHLDVDFDGTLSWNGRPLKNREQLTGLLHELASAHDDRVLRIRPQRLTRYDNVAPILALAQRSGVRRVSLEPVPDRG